MIRRHLELWVPPVLTAVGTVLLAGITLYVTAAKRLDAVEIRLERATEVAKDTNSRVRTLECNSEATMGVLAGHLGGYQKLLEEKEKVLRLKERHLEDREHALNKRESALSQREFERTRLRLKPTNGRCSVGACHSS